MEDQAVIQRLVFFSGEGPEMEAVSVMASSYLYTFLHHRATLRITGSEIFWILNRQRWPEGSTPSELWKCCTPS